MNYKQINCPICNKAISIGGAAYVSHMRMHVRQQEAIEHTRNGKLLFLKADQNIVDLEPYAKLGDDPLPGQPKGVWEITDNLADLIAIDPASYFTTSGEAVKKAEKLVQDVYAMASKVRAFRDKLKRARGLKKYLETARESGRLLVKCKEPRKHDDEDIGI